MTRAPTRNLRPAEIKDGRYVRPYVFLEIEQLWCGAPRGLDLARTRYHVMTDGGVAACRSKQQRWRPYSVILLGALIPIGNVPGHMCCQRNGCRQVFDAFLA